MSHAGSPSGGWHRRRDPTSFATATPIIPPAKNPTIANQHPIRYRARLGGASALPRSATSQYAASTRAAFTMSAICGST